MLAEETTGTGMHAKGHLREAFEEAVDEHGMCVRELPADAPVGGDQQGRPLTWGQFTGLLWNCTDVIPVYVCNDLDFPQGSSYAHLVRDLRTGAPSMSL